MKIADVYNEKSREYYRQENASEYAYITAEEYAKQDVLNTEKMLVNMFNFNLYSPTTVHFLKIYDSILNLSEPVRIISNVKFYFPELI